MSQADLTIIQGGEHPATGGNDPGGHAVGSCFFSENRMRGLKSRVTNVKTTRQDSIERV